MTTSKQIIDAAVATATLKDALHVQELLKASGRVDDFRPLGDTWNNHGLMGSAGSYDYKLIELATNMQDAVLELFALRKFHIDHEVPFTNPHAAAKDLFEGKTEVEMADSAAVTFRESDPPANKTKRLTAVFRDLGCGLSPEMVPRTIFRLGGSRKEDALYLQGAFGMGGAMTYRNASAVVLVTRRDPSLLNPGEEDRITVAVVEWRDNTKGRTALYLVDGEWNEPGDEGVPWSCPAVEAPDFAPGTHLALISYRTDGIHLRTERDEKVFNTLADTRLFDPVMPLRFVNETDRGRRTILRGLKGRLDRTSATSFPSDTQALPFRVGTETYHLPIRYVLFSPRKTEGGIDSFVAAGHALMFTSNGQVHHHWSPSEFRQRTGFNKIYNRVLVVVETDELPILLRTSLFTSDRNDMVRTDNSIRLEEAVVGALQGWEELDKENRDLVREGLRAGADQLTADLGRKIGMAFKATGFGFSTGRGNKGGPGNGGGRSGGGQPGLRRPVELHTDPTKVTGAAEVQAELNSTKSISFIVDAIDDFWNGRGILQVGSDHPEIGDREITVGKGRNGRVRVLIAIPETAQLGTFAITALLADWHRAGGGLGPELVWTTKMEIVEEIEGRNSGAGKRPTGAGSTGERGAGGGGNVALQWTNHEARENWSKLTVGEVEQIRAVDLAESVAEYRDLAALGDVAIPTISLNEEYPPFKQYLENRSRELVGLDRPRDQYALGIGLALLVLDDAAQKAAKRGTPYPEEMTADAGRAAARGVLAVMPQFDQMIKQAGLTPD